VLESIAITHASVRVRTTIATLRGGGRRISPHDVLTAMRGALPGGDPIPGRCVGESNHCSDRRADSKRIHAR